MAWEKILVWLPSPLGDAISCTPALRAIRSRFKSSQIYFLAEKTLRDILSPNDFNDEWIDTSEGNIFTLAFRLRRYNLSAVILFKNSFGSALTASMAGIEKRIGYARDGRSSLLTERINPQKNTDGSFKPVTMIDYYLTIAEHLGCDTDNRQTELLIDQTHRQGLSCKLPELFSDKSPLVVLVPGGAFGPSKCWPGERFAETADRLIDDYGAKVFVSVAPNDAERQIAERICQQARHKLYTLTQTALTMGELKSLFSQADLVITNDTGPRHIAIALGRKVITIFGPNNPQWTQTGYPDEVQIIGKGDCVPCERPRCTQQKHICMESISVDMVYDSAKKKLQGINR